MAVYFRSEPGLGGRLGTALGTGLSTGINRLVEDKLKDMQSKKLEAGGLPGVLAQLDPQVQAAYLKQYAAAQQLAQKEEQEQSFQNLLEETLGGKQTQPQYPVQEGSPAAQVVPTEELNTPEASLSRNIQRIEDRLVDPRLSATQKARLREQKTLFEDRLNKQASALQKETKEFYQKTMKDAHAAAQSDKRLERMKELIQTGNLTNPVFASALETLSKGIFGFGIDLFSLTNPQSQEFRKLTTDFVREAKDIYGTRLTDADLKSFLQMIPTLSQDNDGKIAVISNIQNMNRSNLIKKEIADQIIKANRGIRPRNLEQLVNEKAAPLLDSLAEEFKSATGRQGSIKGTQSLLGSVVKAPLKAVGVI